MTNALGQNRPIWDAPDNFEWTGYGVPKRGGWYWSYGRAGKGGPKQASSDFSQDQYWLMKPIRRWMIVQSHTRFPQTGEHLHLICDPTGDFWPYVFGEEHAIIFADEGEAAEWAVRLVNEEAPHAWLIDLASPLSALQQTQDSQNPAVTDNPPREDPAPNQGDWIR